MRGRRRGAAIVASPVLVGAVTTLVAIVAVFLAYNANQGLPFVPTYELKAQLPDGAKLVVGNEVRVGGFRVGVVEKITTTELERGGRRRAVAVVDLKLDKVVEPLASDSQVQVRQRSALGLKYVELTPGGSDRTFAPGDTIPLGNGAVDDMAPRELEDVLATFDAPTRRNARRALSGFGDGLAGRGPAINQAIDELGPLLRHLRPVMRNLSDRDTRLAAFFTNLGRAAAEAAPVAATQAALFTHMADTFAAIGRDPGALRATIEQAPETLQVATRSFRAQIPFLRDFTELSELLQPAVAELPRSLPDVNSALARGTEVLPRTVALNERLGDLFGELTQLGENPNTLLAVRDLDTTLSVTQPLLDFATPFQTVCNFTVYFLNPLGTHISVPAGGGTGERVLLKQANRSQPNSLATQQSSRPVDVPSDEDPRADNGRGEPPAALHTQYGGPAVDGAGRADCQAGQTGYPNRLVRDGRYPPSPDPDKGGGSHVVLDPDTPGRRGGTFKSRELGIESVGDLP